jgi:hypothetical protein
VYVINYKRKDEKHMNRDIKKQMDQGRTIIRRHPAADLRASELLQFVEMHDRKEAEAGNRNGLYELIEAAFLMGVAVGARNA